jgi:hypothetical protein
MLNELNPLVGTHSTLQEILFFTITFFVTSRWQNYQSQRLLTTFNKKNYCKK